MIHVIEQKVELLVGNPTEQQFFQNMMEILSTPYAKDLSDFDKVRSLIKVCIRKGHESVLEHLNISLKCITNIGTYKDITRHRHCAFTIESTSFVNYSGDLMVIGSHQLDLNAIETAWNAYKNLSPKMGRDYLPQCVAAKMIITTNIREWRYICGLRCDPNDNPSTIEWCKMVTDCLQTYYPFFFQEIEIKKEWL